MNKNLQSAWIDVSRAALRHNFGAVKSLVGSGVQTIAVVKANAFGHGAGETARTFQAAGADFFAVTTLFEATELRDAGIAGRILVFLPPLPEQIEALLMANCDLTVCDSGTVSAVAEAARRQGITANIQLKVDTGMGRLGVLPGEVLTVAKQIAANSHLRFAGVYTHFARALEKDDAATRRQFAVFQEVLSELEANQINPGLRHCANSAALVRFPEMRLDAVRTGTILYGQYPSAAVPRSLKLEETWRMSARIVSVRELPPGSTLGYGGEFVTRRSSKIAVLPVGYADGFATAPQSASKGLRGLRQFLKPAPISVIVRGKCALVVGRVAMQTCLVDVTDIADVSVGDSAVIPVRRLMASARLPRFFTEQFNELNE